MNVVLLEDVKKVGKKGEIVEVSDIPAELEESAMIDGASVPRIFFQIVVPIMKPSIVSVAILEAMWIWTTGQCRCWLPHRHIT